ncbi:hypothetical protein [Micromonospora sp. NPDC005174]|uniref:hypothetical protein n=1 Tax=Micromonospora sp. NPDC005174 TaxID=3157018 RepID=UPI0033BEDA41
MSFFDKIRPGHGSRNDGPAFHDLKPQALPADYGTHPDWCRQGHDGPCSISFAVTDPNGVRVKLTVGYNDADCDTTLTVEVGGRAARLDGDNARRSLLRLTGWLTPTTRRRPKAKQ